MTAAARVSDRARDWAIRAVQWGPARIGLKRGAHVYARARGAALKGTGRVPEIANIYAASSPKAGSQWMRALLDHPVVRSHTGLFAVPQLDYQENPEKGFPPGVFVPGLYVRYDEYKRIPHRYPHRCVYMFRDPRDLVVSGYYSAVKTHQNTFIEDVERAREEIRQLPFDEGLLKLIEVSADRLRDVATWVGVDDPNVAFFKLEEVQLDERAAVVRMLEHCGVSLSADELEAVMSDVSRESLQSKDLAQRKPGSESHYRVDRKTFRDVFKPEHYEAIERIVPGLVADLGYPE
jgi:hypothetical protein